MYFIGDDFSYEKPAMIQVNIEQQIQLSDIIFSLKPGFLFFYLFTFILRDMILYFSSFGSKQLLLAEVMEIIDNQKASVKQYEKQIAGKKFIY